ncbi:MAG: hypothetical protein HOV80_24780 [Polyangiaceae bacterium]|nr:hypothetical protein [Polyangiaceae bacterium]
MALGLGAGCAAGNEDEADGEGGGDPKPPKAVPAKGISVTDVDFYQGIEIPFVRAGQDVPATVPVVAGRDAYLRVGFTVDADFAPRPVRLRISFESASATLEPVDVEVPVGASSNPASLASTLNAAIPGASILTDSSFRVDILELDPDEEHSEALGTPGWPAEGSTSFGAQDAGSRTKIVLVPVVYNPDGSGRTPDMSEAQVELYRSRVLSMYPTPAVEIEIGQPWNYNGPSVEAFGNGWGELLASFANAHHGGGSDPYAYYYGLFSPDSSFNSYCGGGCVTGLSYSSVQPFDDDARSSVSLGFTGLEFADTMAHELGHAHGQGAHAPCGGAGDVDNAYPYPGGGIGVLGMDVAKVELKKPTEWKDLMGYCTQNWISDYTYRLFFSRTQALAQVSMAKYQGPSRAWRAFAVREDGSLYDVGTSQRTMAPGGNPVRVDARRQSGEPAQLDGVFLPNDHLPGGMLLVPEEPGLTALRITN